MADVEIAVNENVTNQEINNNIENEQEHYEQGNFITKPLPFEVDNKISEYSIGFNKSSINFLFIF